MGSEPGPKGFSTPAVCAITGVPLTTLNAWAGGIEPLVTASLLGSAGKRSPRFWSARDLVVVQSIRALRDAGCPLQQIREASRRVHEWFDSDLGSTVLYWDGTDVMAMDSWGDIYSLIRHPGQQVLHVVVLPLSEWREAAISSPAYCDVDVASIDARRQARRTERLEATQSLSLAPFMSSRDLDE
jgi:DNA-binding transcriptional MerR regulator